MRLHDLVEDYSQYRNKTISTVLEQYFIIDGDFSVDIEGLISVNGSVIPSGGKKLDKLPVNFETVNGRFACDNMGLTTLEGCPKYIKGNFNCRDNKLESFYGGPEEVERSFVCANNEIPLKNLIGSPKRVQHFILQTPIESLEGLPEIIRGKIEILNNETLPLLRLLFVKELKMIRIIDLINHDELEDILNKYIGQGRAGAIQCAAELTRAGYKGNAKL